MATKLYVGNLSYQTTEQDLNRLFSESGTVVSAQVITDRDTGQPAVASPSSRCRPRPRPRRRSRPTTARPWMAAPWPSTSPAPVRVVAAAAAVAAVAAAAVAAAVATAAVAAAAVAAAVATAAVAAAVATKILIMGGGTAYAVPPFC